MSQQRLFDDLPSPWEEDDRAEELVATVVFRRRGAGRV